MKRTILALVAIFVFTSIVKASPVDPQQAIQVAQQFVPKSTTSHRASMRGSQSEPSSSIVYTHMMPSSNRPAFYIVNVDDGAFVLVSADDIAHQVLGYSLSSKWPVSNDGTVEIPEHVKGFFDDLAAQMAAAIEAEPDRAPESDWTNSRSFAPSRSNPSLPDSVGPLLTTTWDQGQYYNALCPEDANGPDGHVYTGCVATAMAQIVKYWNDAVSGRGTHSYNTNYGTLTVNYEEASYDYASMPNSLNENSSHEQINTVAQLIYHCGVATNMQYGANESSSFDRDARAGLINFFNFSPNMSYAERAYFSNTEWDDLICENIAANHPVLYSGFGISGGHSFVCDGYKSGDFYHFNFGWGGLADGWYLTNAVTPNDMNYSSSQSAIVGIVPDNNSNVIIGQMYGNSTFIVDEPLRYYNIMGRNLYVNGEEMNGCNNTVSFISSDNNKCLVLDIINFEDQLVNIYEGTNKSTRLRSLYGGNENDLSPVVSNGNSLTLNYIGNFSYLGFDLCISQNSESRMVSNITSLVNSNSVELSWKENGNATSWKIEYGQAGFTIGEGTQLTTNDTTITVNGLTRYVDYDFYIRPQSEGIWYGPIRLQPMPRYWIDVVDSQPEGYIIGELDDKGQYPITITTAEGLAWWAKQVIIQGSTQPIAHTTVNLAADIDLGQYRWKSIPEFYGTFNGSGHMISNMQIIEKGANNEDSGYGFFRFYRGYAEDNRQSISNLFFRDPIIKIFRGSMGVYYNGEDYLSTPTTYYVAGSGILAGRIFCATIENCGVNNATINQAFLSPTMFDGLLVGQSEESDITNSYASGNISSVSSRVGGLIGCISGHVGGQGSNITNCYSSAIIKAFENAGSICGYMDGANIKNCYGINNIALINFDPNSNSLITDTMRFDKETLLLSESILFDGIKYDDLISALNAKVQSENNNSLRLWIADNNAINNGLPILGDFFEVICPNANNVTAVNIKKNTGYATHVTWNNDPLATYWRVKYWDVDSIEETAHYLTTKTNEIDIDDIIIGEVYNICVQQIYDEMHRSGWGSPIQIMFDKPYWTDIVTSQPEGYLEDSDGNVTISSAEGLAWFACMVNGLNNQEHKSFRSKIVSLSADIDLSEYKWMPIGYNYDYTFQGTFDGKNHTIRNIYVNERHYDVGLFGYVYQHNYKLNKKISNIILENCTIIGESNVGGIIGRYHSYDDLEPIILFNNCHVFNASISGDNNVGALLGRSDRSGVKQVMNCSSTGEITGLQHVGGLLGAFQISSNNRVENCYSTCNINADNNAGGIIGFAQDVIINNVYASCTIQCDGSHGSLIGFLCSDISCSNIYGLKGNSHNPLFGALNEPNTINFSDTASYSITGILNNPISINNNTYTDILSVLNAWVNTYDDERVFLHWVADSNEENDGFPLFESVRYYSLTILISDNNPSGTVHGNGYYSHIEPIIIHAIPNYGYHFVRWNDGNTDNPRLIKLTQDTVFTAVFAKNLYKIVGNTTAGVDYSFDFERTDQDEEWTLLNENYVNRWHIGNITNDNRAIFISSNEGETNQYRSSSNSYVFAYTTINLIPGQYSYIYDWKCNGENNWDYLRVALVPSNREINVYEWDYQTQPLYAIPLDDGYQLVSQEYWTTANGSFTIDEEKSYNLILYWHNQMEGNQPPAAVDNIILHNETFIDYSHMGYVTGSDTVEYLDEVELHAIPNDGYMFVKWNDGNTDNPRTIIALSDYEYRAIFDTCTFIMLYESTGINEEIASSISGKKAIFKRSFTEDKATTICLPFGMTSINNGKVYEFIGVEFDANTGWTATMRDATPSNNVTSTTANTPYLFVPNVTGEVTFSGILDNIAANIEAGTTSSSDTYWNFCGTYSRLDYGTEPMTGHVYGFASRDKTVDGQDIVAGQFVKAKDGAYIQPFRAYLSYTGSNSALLSPKRGSEIGSPDNNETSIPERITVRLLDGNGTITAIGTMDTITGDVTIERWFDMNGIPIKGLPAESGMYLNNNGKKILIK